MLYAILFSRNHIFPFPQGLLMLLLEVIVVICLVTSELFFKVYVICHAWLLKSLLSFLSSQLMIEERFSKMSRMTRLSIFAEGSACVWGHIFNTGPGSWQLCLSLQFLLVQTLKVSHKWVVRAFSGCSWTHAQTYTYTGASRTPRNMLEIFKALMTFHCPFKHPLWRGGPGATWLSLCPSFFLHLTFMA